MAGLCWVASCTSAPSSELPLGQVVVPGTFIGDGFSSRPRGLIKVLPQDGPRVVYDLTRRHRIIFVNGQGGMYRAGNDEDSRINLSSITNSNVTMPAYSKGASAWQQFLSCIRDEYARFDAEVTDVDPGNADHIEAVISGTPDMIGMPQGVGGVAPMNPDCSTVENGIVWIFEQVFGSATTDCEVAAQEISHAIGLDHEYLCQDPMTYLDGCGRKTFQDQDVRCGEYSPRDCMCADPRNGSPRMQNSVQFMLGRLGPASGAGGSGGGGGSG
ncbi:MAG TPA: hypothetical protein VKN99_19330, partial [Polyangia bacterium]|nr:hypothetical protein [Polyangia bacterium]